MSQDIDDQLFKRMVLYNQYLILSHLDKSESQYWNRAASIVQKHWPVDELPGVNVFNSYAREPLTRNLREELLDTLDMYEVLQDAEDRGCTSPQGFGADFPGYSGNEEVEFLSYYRDLVEQGERWPSLRRSNARDLNSHFPHRDSYKRMLAKWKALGSPRHLSQANFEQILFERVHPENRKPTPVTDR